MSWIEKIQTDFVIKTGDGKTYKPFWLKSSYGYDFNVTQFDFPDKSGTLVKRGLPKGRSFPISIYFQGEDHLDISEDFRISANDAREWTITHPFYGQIIVQPISLDFNNDDSNVSLITGNVIETITEDNPKLTTSAVDKIIADKAITDEYFSQSYGNDVTPTVSDVNELSSNNQTVYSNGAKTVKSKIDSETYFNLFNEANSSIINATADPLVAIRKTQAVISYPFLFSNSVKERLGLLINQFNLLRATRINITTRNQKKLYENNVGSVISTMAATASTPLEGDYGNRSDVLKSITPLVDSYNQYVVDLDELQSENGGSVGSYIPDATSLNALNALINFTVSNLFNIALDAKQERSIILEEDSNIMIVTHRLYGLDEDDVNINKLISQNNLGLNSMLQLRKGERIIYYV